MTSVLEKAISFLAPHRCLVCSVPNNIICEACMEAVPMLELSCCVLCGRPTADWRICKQCPSHLDYVWPCHNYEGVCAVLMYALKFQRVRAAADICAVQLDARLPYLSQWLVVHLPTSPARARQRGYDQAVLLARALAKRRGLTYAPLLGRWNDNRQVGASRAARAKQAARMFYLKKYDVRGCDILLVDDVCTTGASLLAAARLLKKAGARTVGGTVVAYKVKDRGKAK